MIPLENPSLSEANMTHKMSLFHFIEYDTKRTCDILLHYYSQER